MSTTTSGVDRRQLLGSGLLLGALAYSPFALWKSIRSGETGEAPERLRAMLVTVCDMVIPATDTPGAVKAGVPAFVELALNHGLDGTRAMDSSGTIATPEQKAARPRGGLYLLDDLYDRLSIRAGGGDFNRAARARQQAALAAIDTAAFAPGGEQDGWHKIKDLIVIGYYTSEAGASQELQYELVPGRYDPDVPVAPGNRAYASDWAAADFG